jgi:hypothetical protein
MAAARAADVSMASDAGIRHIGASGWCGHDGNRRGWRSEAAKPPRDQTTGKGIRKQWTAAERILSEA